MTDKQILDHFREYSRFYVIANICKSIGVLTKNPPKVFSKELIEIFLDRPAFMPLLRRLIEPNSVKAILMDKTTKEAIFCIQYSEGVGVACKKQCKQCAQWTD